MGTTADKLNKLLETKAAIKSAIQGKGQEVADDDTFASYADKISNIETGKKITVTDDGAGTLIFSDAAAVLNENKTLAIFVPIETSETDGNVTVGG